MPDSFITFTPNLHLTKLPANYRVWAQIMNDNLTLVDASINGFVQFSNLRGPWTNSTVYAVGDTVVDQDTAVLHTALTAHTSAQIPTTFAEDALAHPTYWTLANAPANARGAWTGPGTTYQVNDFVLAEGTKYAMCLIQHVSQATFATDFALGRWSVLVDLSLVGSLVLPVLSGAIDAKKFVSVNPTGTAYQIVDGVEAMDRLSGILPIVKGGTGSGTANGTGNPVFTTSPALLGTPTAPTAAYPSNTTQMATTAYVTAALAAGASISVGVAPPVSPAANQLWWNSDASVGGGMLYIYYNDGSTTQWVPTAAPAGSGVLQTVSFVTGAMATGTTLIPFDDTIPQQTEGDQYMSLLITPRSATSRLVIDVKVQGASSVASVGLIAALFQDATANALAMSAFAFSGAGQMTATSFTHVMTSGTTSATTFKVRAGINSAGTFTFNGITGARYFGGVMASSIVISEVL